MSHRGSKWVVLGMFLCSAVASAQPAEEPGTMAVPTGNPPVPRQPRQGEPAQWLEQDVRAFVDQINGLDKTDSTIGSRYIDGRLGYYGANDWLKQIKQYTKMYTLRVDNVQVDKLEGKTATVTVESSVQGRFGGQVPAEIPKFKETTTWRLGKPSHRLLLAGEEENLWRIVPSVLDLRTPKVAPLAMVAFGLGQMPEASALISSGAAMASLGRLMRVVMQFLQDYDDQFLFDAAHFREAVAPYAADESIFKIPGTREEFTLNGALAGHSRREVADVSKVVVIYDGAERKLNYRYGGMALIGFADGHAALVGPAEAEKLVWEIGAK